MIGYQFWTAPLTISMVTDAAASASMTSRVALLRSPWKSAASSSSPTPVTGRPVRASPRCCRSDFRAQRQKRVTRHKAVYRYVEETPEFEGIGANDYLLACNPCPIDASSQQVDRRNVFELVGPYAKIDMELTVHPAICTGKQRRNRKKTSPSAFVP